MVGFKPERTKKGLTAMQCGICGSMSGIFTRLLTQPLDVVKIRFQLQIEPISKVSAQGKYSGVWQAFRSMCQEEGIKSMWKGHVPAQMLSVVYGYVQFTVFEVTTKVAWTISPKLVKPEWKPATHFLCGGIAGFSASCATLPLDGIRTRLVAQGEPKIYRSLTHAAYKMYTKEGLTSFYKGLVPTMAQVFPYAGLQFGFYTMFKTMWESLWRIQVEDYEPASVVESLVCGALSGVCSKGLIYPLDMLKKRMQIQGFQKARRQFGRVQEYDGMIDCVRVIVREEGMAAFFKGLYPSTLKAALSVAITFCTYEQCISLFRQYIHAGADPDASFPASMPPR